MDLHPETGEFRIEVNVVNNVSLPTTGYYMGIPPTL